MIKRILLLITLQVTFINAQAQHAGPGAPGLPNDEIGHSIHINKTNEKIILDGMLTEAAWFKGNAQGKFWQYFPTDSLLAQGETEIYMTYDDEYVYIAAVCKSINNDFVVPSLRRDYGFFGSDNITILFDTYADITNAIVFGLNPYGVRREALVSNGGRERGSWNQSWDNKWFGESKIYDDHWIAEFAIPFKTLRFKEGATRWRFNAYRSDTQLNERSSWMKIPRNRIITDMNYMGDIIWDQPLRKPGKNVSIIPYTAGAITRNFEDETEDGIQSDFNVGGDAKIGITSGLNLDLTFNPDFSQVEVDQQVTNLDRFEIFFPERRQFFLENADLFGNFSSRRLNPFFSRRIGVAQDTATGQNIQNTILFGARLSGKVNNRMRIGLLNMQTAKQTKNDLPSFNYSVAALEQTVFDRSQVAFIFVNKQAVNPDDFGSSFNLYNRVGGIEYRVASKNNYWQGKLSYLHAFTPNDEPGKYAHLALMSYIRRKYTVTWAHSIIGEGFNAEVGFVPRRDILVMNPEVRFNFFPKNNDRINQHNLNFESRFIYKLGQDDSEIIEDFGLAEWTGEIEWSVRFKSNDRFEIGAEYNDLTLLNDFDPTRMQEEDIFLPAGSNHKFINFRASFNSDNRRKVFYRIQPNIGQFYNGFRAGLRGSLTFRYQPYGFVSLNYTYNHINLGDSFETANLWLIGPRIDLTFSRKLFLTTFIQYNSQLNNLNINTRFQWRFKPVSDFFLVYTDNYLTSPFDQFSSRNRALVAKVTYWLNL